MTIRSHHPAPNRAPLLTIKDTAARLNVSVKSVRRWIKDGELVAHRLGRQLRVSEQDLTTFLAARRGVNLVSSNDHQSLSPANTYYALGNTLPE